MFFIFFLFKLILYVLSTLVSKSFKFFRIFENMTGNYQFSTFSISKLLCLLQSW